MLNQIEKVLKEESETKETQDEVFFYGQTAATSIRKLGNMEKCMIKHEINNILFKHQMSMYKAENTASTSQRITYPTPPTPTRFSVVTSNDFNGNIAMHEISHKPPHMATDSLCNQLTYLTNIKRKKHIFLCIHKVGLGVTHIFNLPIACVKLTQVGGGSSPLTLRFDT